MTGFNGPKIWLKGWAKTWESSLIVEPRGTKGFTEGFWVEIALDLIRVRNKL